MACKGAPALHNGGAGRSRGQPSHEELNAARVEAYEEGLNAGRAEMLRLLSQDYAEAYFCGDETMRCR